MISSEKLTQAIIALVVGVTSVLIARNSSFLEVPDKWFIDWRAAYFGDQIKGARNDITVVLISEESLSAYPYPTSLDRGYLAKLLVALDEARPSSIGLDFVFDHPTENEKDLQLIDTIKNLKSHIILGSFDKRSPRVTPNELEYQEKFLKATGRKHGHIYLSMEGGRLNTDDNTVRYIPAGAELVQESFSGALSSASKKDEFLIAWLNGDTFDAASPFAVISLAPSSPDAIPAEVFPRTLNGLIEGRTILIGGNFTERDQHLTPFSVWNGVKSPGVLAHAHAYSQLKDGRSWRFAPFWLEAAYSTMLAWLSYMFFQRIRLSPYHAALFVSFSFMIALFYFAKIILPIDAPVVAVSIGMFLGTEKSRRKIMAISARIKGAST